MKFYLLTHFISHPIKNRISIKRIIFRTLEKNHNHIKIEFMDNGIGVSDTRKSRILKKKCRKKVNTKGLGISISLVNKIVNYYHGKNWVEDRIIGFTYQGSNFVFLLKEAS